MQNENKSIQQEIVEQVIKPKLNPVRQLQLKLGSKRKSTFMNIVRNWFKTKEQKKVEEKNRNREKTPNDYDFNLTIGKKEVIKFCKEKGIKYSYSGKNRILYLQDKISLNKVKKEFNTYTNLDLALMN